MKLRLMSLSAILWLSGCAGYYQPTVYDQQQELAVGMALMGHSNYQQPQFLPVQQPVHCYNFGNSGVTCR